MVNRMTTPVARTASDTVVPNIPLVSAPNNRLTARLAAMNRPLAPIRVPTKATTPNASVPWNS